MGLTKINDIGCTLIPAIPTEYVLPLDEEMISEIIARENENNYPGQCREPKEKMQERYDEVQALGR